MKWFKKLIGNWWIPFPGDRYYFKGSWVPLNPFRKMVMEPYENIKECQTRCNELNTPKKKMTKRMWKKLRKKQRHARPN